MDEEEKKRAKEDGEKMESMRRNIEALKKVSEDLNLALADDLNRLEDVRKDTDSTSMRIERAFHKLKRMKMESFNFEFFATVAVFGVLVFIVYLFWK